MFQAEDTDDKWEEVNSNAPEVRRAAEAALKAYEDKTGKKYTYLLTYHAYKQLVNGVNYKLDFVANYDPNELDFYLRCEALVNESLRFLLPPYVIKSVHCVRKRIIIW